MTEGIFSPRSTAKLGNKPGLVAARMVRLLAYRGFSKHSLNSQVLEGRERGINLALPGLSRALQRLRQGM